MPRLLIVLLISLFPSVVGADVVALGPCDGKNEGDVCKVDHTCQRDSPTSSELQCKPVETPSESSTAGCASYDAIAGYSTFSIAFGALLLVSIRRRRTDA